MKKSIILSTLLAMITFFPLATQAHAWSGNINLFLGAKALDENEWAPLDSQSELGILFDFKGAHWPFSIAIDYLRSKDDEAFFNPFTGNVGNLEGKTSELNIGIRKILDHHSNVRPYLGGGLALIRAEMSLSERGIRVSDNDRSVGFWVNGGIYWTLADIFNIGVDLRYSKADVTLFGVDAGGGGAHAGLLLGFHW